MREIKLLGFNTASLEEAINRPYNEYAMIEYTPDFLDSYSNLVSEIDADIDVLAREIIALEKPNSNDYFEDLIAA